jgi:hypothetical protein
MFVSFRPGDGKRLEIGLALALKELEKATKALDAIALPPVITIIDQRAELEAAQTEVKRWIGEYGDAPREAELKLEQRQAMHIGAYRYNTDTDKLLERKKKQGRDTMPEEEEIQRTSTLIDHLLDRVKEKAA